jgi:hypothetical protein
MKALITLVLVFAVYWVGKSVFDQYKAKQAKDNPPAEAQKEAHLDGLPPQFEASLQHAESQGAPCHRNSKPHSSTRNRKAHPH